MWRWHTCRAYTHTHVPPPFLFLLQHRPSPSSSSFNTSLLTASNKKKINQAGIWRPSRPMSTRAARASRSGSTPTTRPGNARLSRLVLVSSSSCLGIPRRRGERGWWGKGPRALGPGLRGGSGRGESVIWRGGASTMSDVFFLPWHTNTRPNSTRLDSKNPQAHGRPDLHPVHQQDRRRDPLGQLGLARRHHVRPAERPGHVPRCVFVQSGVAASSSARVVSGDGRRPRLPPGPPSHQ